MPIPFRNLVWRINWALDRKPRVHQPDYPPRDERFPKGFRSAVIVSADLELAWGWCRVRGRIDPVKLALQKAEQARKNLPFLLDLFERFNIPVTWATVGHLFLESCRRDESGEIHPEIERPPYFTSEFWEYSEGDWFDVDPCASYKESPGWYAPDLLQAISASPVSHEIGGHTFSHINMDESVCSSETARGELNASSEAAKRLGITLTSFAFPGNHVGNTAVVAEAGYRSTRKQERWDLGYPFVDPYGLLNFPGGLGIEEPSPRFGRKAWLKCLRKTLHRAEETGTLLSLWFHPSISDEDLNELLVPVCENLNEKREEIWLTTMNGFADFYFREVHNHQAETMSGQSDKPGQS